MSRYSLTGDTVGADGEAIGRVLPGETERRHHDGPRHCRESRY
jgi:hypothetical protein